MSPTGLERTTPTSFPVQSMKHHLLSQSYIDVVLFHFVPPCWLVISIIFVTRSNSNSVFNFFFFDNSFLTTMEPIIGYRTGTVPCGLFLCSIKTKVMIRAMVDIWTPLTILGNDTLKDTPKKKIERREMRIGGFWERFRPYSQQIFCVTYFRKCFP